MTRLLLDTEAFIWWDADDARLGREARSHIRDADDVYVSAASAWEVAIKVALDKLRTTREPADAVRDSGFSELPVTFEHAAKLRALPRHHRDPFDRLIIAAALSEGLTIVTSDGQFDAYDVTIVHARR